MASRHLVETEADFLTDGQWPVTAICLIRYLTGEPRLQYRQRHSNTLNEETR